MKNYIIHIALFLIGGFILYTFLQTFLPIWLSVIITMTIVTIIGVWKEKYDKRNGGKFDWWDLIMDIAGGIEGIVIAIEMEEYDYIVVGTGVTFTELKDANGTDLLTLKNLSGIAFTDTFTLNSGTGYKIRNMIFTGGNVFGYKY